MSDTIPTCEWCGETYEPVGDMFGHSCSISAAQQQEMRFNRIEKKLETLSAEKPMQKPSEWIEERAKEKWLEVAGEHFGSGFAPAHFRLDALLEYLDSHF